MLTPTITSSEFPRLNFGYTLHFPAQSFPSNFCDLEVVIQVLGIMISERSEILLHLISQHRKKKLNVIC